MNSFIKLDHCSISNVSIISKSLVYFVPTSEECVIIVFTLLTYSPTSKSLIT